MLLFNIIVRCFFLCKFNHCNLCLWEFGKTYPKKRLLCICSIFIVPLNSHLWLLSESGHQTSLHSGLMQQILKGMLKCKQVCLDSNSVMGSRISMAVSDTHAVHNVQADLSLFIQHSSCSRDSLRVNNAKTSKMSLLAVYSKKPKQGT